jgi:hypothetical protein
LEVFRARSFVLLGVVDYGVFRGKRGYHQNRWAGVAFWEEEWLGCISKVPYWSIQHTEFDRKTCFIWRRCGMKSSLPMNNNSPWSDVPKTLSE